MNKKAANIAIRNYQNMNNIMMNAMIVQKI